MTGVFPEVQEALDSEATVTVVLEDGRTFTGSLVEHPTKGDNWLVVRLGTRGRPPVIHAADVVEVIFE